jgi:hypothetical protein
MSDVTKGNIHHSMLDGKDEAYFYYPHDSTAHFPEPLVFAVGRMQRALETLITICAKENRAPNPDRIIIFRETPDPEAVARLIANGAVERPLIENAKRQLIKDDAEGTTNFCLFALATKPGEPMGGPLIDGAHRYVASHELGRESIWSIGMYRPFWQRFTVRGIPFSTVKLMLGSGPDETSRYDGERLFGLREMNGDLYGKD